MKKTIAVLLSALLLGGLAGCAKEPVPAETKPTIAAPTVENLFTKPEDSQEMETTGDFWSYLVESFRYAATESDDNGSYCTYDGGEMHLPYCIECDGLSRLGIGFLLFLDGQPQPYKTADDDRYQYLHVFYPADGEETIVEWIFTPVTGQAGDCLEICALSVIYPNSLPSDSNDCCIDVASHVGISARIQFNAAPPELELPEVQNRVITQTVYYEDLTSEEIAGWSDEDLRTKIETHLSVNGVRDDVPFGCYEYNSTAMDSLPLKFEIWGTPLTTYGLMFYVDNEPIGVAEENRIFLDVQSGKKTVVETTIDFSDFDHTTVIYAVLAPRNLLTRDGNAAADTYTWMKGSTEFYLTSAASYGEMIASGN